MTFFSKRKRKNDDPPRFPAWILVLIAIGLVIIIEIIFQPANTVTAPAVMSAGSTFTLDPIKLTATYIIGQATAMAQGTPQPGVIVGSDNLDPLQVTATYLVVQATALAQGTPQEAMGLDPIELTATYVVKQATSRAGTPNS